MSVRSLKTGPMTAEQAHMQAAKNLAELVARRAQVKALRSIAKTLYESIKNAPVRSVRQALAMRYYEREMKA